MRCCRVADRSCPRWQTLLQSRPVQIAGKYGLMDKICVAPCWPALVANLSRWNTYNGWLPRGMDSGSGARSSSRGGPRGTEFPKATLVIERRKEAIWRGAIRSIETLRLPSRVITGFCRWDSHRCCKRHGTILRRQCNRTRPLRIDSNRNRTLVDELLAILSMPARSAHRLTGTAVSVESVVQNSANKTNRRGRQTTRGSCDAHPVGCRSFQAAVAGTGSILHRRRLPLRDNR